MEAISQETINALESIAVEEARRLRVHDIDPSVLPIQSALIAIGLWCLRESRSNRLHEKAWREVLEKGRSF